MRSKFYKSCAVPECASNTKITPDKLFIYVPCSENIRKKWLQLARRDPALVPTNSKMYFCEDHFDLPNDMENYTEYHLMGSVSQVRMKAGCLPLKFACQPDRKRRTANETIRPLAIKRQRLESIAEFEREMEAAQNISMVETQPGPSSGYREMSQKILKRKRKENVRAIPVETILTRFKSSQFSQQKKTLQEQSETKSTKFNKTYSKSRKGATKKQPEIKETESNEEYYPDKMKRLFEKKQIVLTPKPTYKLIGGLSNFNKRKLRKPIKETPSELNIQFPVKNAEALSSKSENVKFVDLICLDDSDSLDEEDLMEILTCPSPVWWEDPPDEVYDEEPLSMAVNIDEYNIETEGQSIKYSFQKHSTVNNKSIESKNNTIHVNNKQDKDFITRRDKLESLLGNIKSKKTNNTFENTNCNSSCSTPENQRQKKMSETLHNVILDEEILKTLENLEIPIENTKESSDNKDNEKSFLETHGEPTYYNDVNKSKTSKVCSVKGLTITKYDTKQCKRKMNKNKVISQKNEQSTKETEEHRIKFLKTSPEECDLKILDNNKKSKEAQPKSHHTTDSNILELTIRKRNRRNRRANKIADNKRTDNNEVPNNDKAKNKSISSNPISDNTSDHVTVYQILSEEVQDSKDTKTENKTYIAQLNYYYNQCKNVNKSRKEIDNGKQISCDTNLKQNSVSSNQKVKTIPVSNTETVQYCLQCSSIFDTDTCNYCAMRSNDLKS